MHFLVAWYRRFMHFPLLRADNLCSSVLVLRDQE